MADAYFMFNVAVFSFCVFSYNHQIHIAMSTKQNSIVKIEGLPAKRAYIAFLADFHFLQEDQANF